MTRATEHYSNWPEARARLAKIRAAGFVAYAVDLDDVIVLHITPGRKHADLTRLPTREN